MSKLTHIDEKGNASMVYIGGKEATEREALAGGAIRMSRDCFRAVTADEIAKGDVLGTARIAGITAAKRTSELIPLCHNIPLEKVDVDFELSAERAEIRALCRIRANYSTGVEMEALTGVSVCLLTIYDMCKAVDKAMTLGEIKLLKKTGGKSGDYIAAEG